MAEVKERPILFNGPMVRAILDGTKTQTRRIVKPCRDRDIGCELAPNELAGEVNAGNFRNAPWQPRDRLWVRETFCDDWKDSCGVVYRADGGLDGDMVDTGCTWRPSIHMPRAASRITLEILAVRVEKLQDISAASALAEGVQVHPDFHSKPPSSLYSPVQAFRDLWSGINGPESWEANPWVWVVQFRRIDATQATKE